MALEAGVDMSMVPSVGLNFSKSAIVAQLTIIHYYFQDYTFSDDLYELAQEDPSIRKIVEASTERILKVKYDLGLFTNPYVSNLSNPNIPTVLMATIHIEGPVFLHFGIMPAGQVGSKADRSLSESAVRESLTLLKNENNALPLAAQVFF